MVSALVTVGIDAGYLVNPRLAKVHWQPGGRPVPPPPVSVAGEPFQWVDPAEIPSDRDVRALGRAVATGLHGNLYQLMAQTAAYTSAGYLLAEKLAARVEAARAEQEAGTNPLGLVFPSPRGGHFGDSSGLQSLRPPVQPVIAGPVLAVPIGHVVTACLQRRSRLVTAAPKRERRYRLRAPDGLLAEPAT